MRVPSILAICALDAHINGKRLSGCQRVAPRTVCSFEIVGMKLPCNKSPCSRCFFQGTAGVTSPLLIDETARSIRLVSCDHRRDRVDSELEFALSLLQLRFAPAQRRVTLRAFDCDARNTRELRDEFLLKLVRASRLALIERKGAQYLSRQRYDRRGPARPQTVRLRERAP